MSSGLFSRTSLSPRLYRAQRPGWGAAFLTLFGLSAFACGVAAQATGTITGTVTEAGNLRPIPAAQVYVAGLSIGALSSENGRYLILNVPAGAHTLVFERIGYQTVRREVTVVAGETQVVDFSVAEEALGLDEIVVTGEAGAARRREVGNSISQINLADVREPVLNTEALLQSRASGLMLSETSAAAGQGSYIRLRGNVSVSQSNQPIIYVDGVRIYSDPLPDNAASVGNARGNSSGASPSTLNTINPEDIERVEIIKGAAATTLYGTEAAAGVIQIFTKSGSQTGAPTWTVQSAYSVQHELEYGVDDFPYMRMEPWLRNGQGHRQDVSVRGGSGDVSYFLSGQYKQQDGVLPLDHEDIYGIRGNLGFQGARGLNVNWNTAFTRQDIQNTPQTNSSAGLPLNVYRGDRNYVGSDDPEAIRGLLDYDLTSQINHLISGVTLRYQPSNSFTHRLTAGYDFNFIEHRNFKPFGFLTDPQGILQNERWSSEILTVDYAGSYAFSLSEGLHNTISFGGQVVNSATASTVAWSQGFPGPGEPTVTSGATQVAEEARIKVVNAGFFFQDRVSVGENLFVTAGIRFDGNSAFGENLGLQAYPKFSASFILSDTDLWNEAWGSLKLRAAWGQSGRAPGAFDAVKTWAPDRLGDQSAFLPQNLGNPDLGPERTTEYELGLDGSFFRDRLKTEVTWYHQTTTDALFPVQQPPSAGDWSAQLENVGELKNRGLEVQLDGTLFDSPEWTVELGAMYSSNNNEVTDMGGLSEIVIENPGYVILGQPAPVLRAQVVTNPDELAAPQYEEQIYGPNMPTTIFGQSVQLRYRNILLSARGEFQGGHHIFSRLEEGDVQRNVKWPPCYPIYDRIATQGIESLTALERSRCIAGEVRRDYFVYDGDFWKLRDVTLQVPVNGLIPWGDSPTLTLSARNALRWMRMPYFDPEMAGQAGQADPVRTIRDNVPPPATFTASLRVSFR